MRWWEKRRKAREDISQLWNMCLWERNSTKERQVRAQEESVDVDVVSSPSSLLLG